MAVTLEKFVQQLEESGVISPESLKDFLPPKAVPNSAEDLAKDLIRQKKLTKFQAEEISRGKGKSLVLGNYVLLEKIGQGGMGAVYKAEHRRMKRTVAIKMLPPSLMENAVAAARFQREVEAAAKLEHPNIVTAHDADEANGAHFLVMQYVDGNDLSALVKKNGPLTVAQAVNCILQAARGLQFAHAEGVVHRDIKPANLLLDKKGTVKILDMGLARIEGDTAGQMELTGTGMVMGTVDYMPPEQALNSKSADARADIYSLGCSLCYLLIGRPTYDGDTVTAKLLAHQNQPIPCLRSLRPEVPEQLDAIFQKMIAKKVDNRYQSITEVITDLEQCVGPQFSVAEASRLRPSSDPSEMTSMNVGRESAPIPRTVTLAPPATTTAAQMAAAAEATMLTGVQTQISQLNSLTSLSLSAARHQTLAQASLRGRAVSPGFRRYLLPIGAAGGVVALLTVVFLWTGFQGGANGKPGGPSGASRAAASIAGAEAPSKAGLSGPGVTLKDPAFQQWVKEVAGLPADKQVDEVGKKLKQLNRGFDGIVIGPDGSRPRIEDGVVTEIAFSTHEITDISPVRAFPGLKRLVCTGTNTPDGSGIGKLSDLSPLQGMKLETLSCPFNKIDDLSPLRGMPLKTLWCHHTGVADLSPLMESELTNLRCSQTKITDLTPLGGLALVSIDFSDTAVADLNPLKGMPLQDVHFSTTAVSNLSPLTGKSILRLACQASPIGNFFPIRDLPLKTIECSPASPRDIAVLRSIKTLETINLKPADEFRTEMIVRDVAFGKWMKYVAALPVDKQAAAVGQKLKELNRGFDGTVVGGPFNPSPTITDGAVTEIAFQTNEVTDITPVRALPGLKRLDCMATLTPDRKAGMGKLSDLSPLQGMKLEALACPFNKVDDLSPVEGMPLTILACDGTAVSDLSPLKGMKLTYLTFYGTNVADLTPLQGMPLDLLWCNTTPVSNLELIKGMKLTSLNCSALNLKDFSWLPGMPLEYLTIQFTGTTDLTPLKGIALKFLDVSHNPVADLTPLMGMPLNVISISSTQVSDLSPLKGMPLSEFHCTGTLVTDLSPIKDFPLKIIVCDLNGPHDVELLRSIKTLETINGQPAADFWKNVEAKQAKKP